MPKSNTRCPFGGVRIVAEQGTVEITLRKDERKEKLQQAARILSALFGDSRLLKQAADVKSAKK